MAAAPEAVIVGVVAVEVVLRIIIITHHLGLLHAACFRQLRVCVSSAGGSHETEDGDMDVDEEEGHEYEGGIVTQCGAARLS